MVTPSLSTITPDASRITPRLKFIYAFGAHDALQHVKKNSPITVLPLLQFALDVGPTSMEHSCVCYLIRRELERHAGSRSAQYRHRHAPPARSTRCSNSHRWLMLRPGPRAVIRVCVSMRRGFDSAGYRRGITGAVQVAGGQYWAGIMHYHV